MSVRGVLIRFQSLNSEDRYVCSDADILFDSVVLVSKVPKSGNDYEFKYKVDFSKYKKDIENYVLTQKTTRSEKEIKEIEDVSNIGFEYISLLGAIEKLIYLKFNLCDQENNIIDRVFISDVDFAHT